MRLYSEYAATPPIADRHSVGMGHRAFQESTRQHLALICAGKRYVSVDACCSSTSQTSHALVHGVLRQQYRINSMEAFAPIQRRGVGTLFYTSLWVKREQTCRLLLSRPAIASGGIEQKYFRHCGRQSAVVSTELPASGGLRAAFLFREESSCCHTQLSGGASTR